MLGNVHSIYCRNHFCPLIGLYPTANPQTIYLGKLKVQQYDFGAVFNFPVTVVMGQR